MPSHRFYCPSLAVGVNELPSEEARHAVTVMRCRPGDSVEVFDGKGLIAAGVIEQISKRKVTVRVEDTQKCPFELRYRLTLAVAMSKTHRQDFLVEKCTELGVAAIWPIIASRSVTKPGEAAVEKWSRRAVEAAKQSGRAWVPTVAPVVSFAEAVSRAGQFHIAFFADLDPAAAPILRVLQAKLSADSVHQDAPYNAGLAHQDGPSTAVSGIIAFVGPEGGWTDDERRAANEAGTTAVSLSPSILRAETAAVAICAAVAASSIR